MPAQQKQAPAPRRKRRSAEDILDRILRAASEEFKVSGYTGATTAAIARKADVTEAQLFRYFSSKAELFREAIFKPLNQHFSDFNARHQQVEKAGNVRDLTQDYITELQQFIGDHSEMLMSLIVAQTYLPGSTQSVGEMDSLGAYFERGAAMLTGRVGSAPRVDPRLMVRVSFVAVLASVMFKDWLFPAGLASEREISMAIIDFVLEGIGANFDPGLEPQ